jgi:hypothetical protein
VGEIIMKIYKVENYSEESFDSGMYCMAGYVRLFSISVIYHCGRNHHELHELIDVQALEA